MTDLTTLGVMPALSETGLRLALAEAFEEVLGWRLVPGSWDAADEAAVRARRSEFPYLDRAPPAATRRTPAKGS